MRSPGQDGTALPAAFAIDEMPEQVMTAGSLWLAFRLRLRRRRLLFRAFRRRGQLASVADRTDAIRSQDILCMMTVRNEADRLPWFLDHHRRLGVDHFLIVDNGSTDTTCALLQDQPDISLWSAGASYKASRFGLDWLTWLQMRHGHGHWCLTLDADEMLIYPNWQTRPLPALTEWLQAQGHDALAAMMLDLYPEGPISAQGVTPGQDPLQSLGWYDAGNYSVTVQPKLRNLWIQGGPRARAFFADTPRLAPTMNKTPLVRWNRRYVYVNSTHGILPPRLNQVYDRAGGEKPSGVLLHTKFLKTAVERAADEKQRGEHFANGAEYDEYYDRLGCDPDLHCDHSTRFTGWRQLEAAGLMSRGGWI